MIGTVRKAAIASLVLVMLGAGLGLPARGDDEADLDAAVSAFEAEKYPAALAGFTPLAKRGNVEAAYWLGHMTQLGLGVAKNGETAAGWFKTAADGGVVEAKVALGNLYLQGDGVLQDFRQARKWFEQAAYDDEAEAQRKLAKLYADGQGGEKSVIWAYVWYDFAASQGDSEAEKARDQLLKSMTAEQVSQAQSLALETQPRVFNPQND